MADSIKKIFKRVKLKDLPVIFDQSEHLIRENLRPIKRQLNALGMRKAMKQGKKPTRRQQLTAKQLQLIIKQLDPPFDYKLQGASFIPVD